MLTRSAYRIRILTVTLVAVLWHPATGNAADPFHERLLQDGIQTYARGDYPLAVKSLRLACFGLLDEPTVLARGLTFLALAQAEIDDEPAFARTFDRIIEIENKFQAFSPLVLEADLRQTFEDHLHRLIAVDVLRRSPAFGHVARRKLEEQILAMAPAERRLELERLVAAEPDNSAWGLQLAELAFDDSDFADALTAAEGVLTHTPGSERARCLRGRAGMETGSCEQALVDLESCHELVEPTVLTEARLRCLVQLGEWQSASVVLAEVPPDRQKKAPFRQLARDVKKGLKTIPRSPPEPPAAGPDTAAEPDAAPSLASDLPEGEVAAPDVAAVEASLPEPSTAEVSAPETPPAANASPLPPELRTELERTRQLVPGSSREQLGEVFADAHELADRFRQYAEPQHVAAEIAYRLSRWPEAVTLFERGGEPSDPDRLFYFSVALYETGDQAEARRVLELCLPSLEMTAFVRSYVDQILGADPGQDT